MVQLLWKTVWSFLKKLKLELTYDTATPLLDTYLMSEKNENINSKRYMHPKLTAALFSIAKIWKQLKYLLMNVRIKKCGICVYTHTHTYSS